MCESQSNSSFPRKPEDDSSNLRGRKFECAVCLSAKAKYTCPACELKTCSLDCVQGHKEALGCTGVRNRVKFKPLSKFTDGDLQNDYILLEELTRISESYSKVRRKSCKNIQLKWYKVRNAAFSRGINLQILPPSFAKRKANTTYCDWSTNVISWRVEWILGSGLKAITELALETKLIRDLLKAMFDSLGKEVRSNLTDLINGPVAVLLPAEKVKGERFFRLDLDASLGEALRNKIVIEFPVLHVIMESNLSNYHILQSEDDFAREVRENGFSIYQKNCMQFFSDKLKGSDDSS